MTCEQLPDEWKECLDLTPHERFRRSEELFAQYLEQFILCRSLISNAKMHLSF